MSQHAIMAARPAGPGLGRLRPPWRDRRGSFSPVRALCLTLLLLPGAMLALEWLSGGLGARPLDEAIHKTGTWAIRLLVATLAVTPLRYILGNARLIGLRRMIGVSALAYALAHVTLYCLDQSLDLGRVAAEILRRSYLTIGFLALIAMSLLGATATDGAIRRLGSASWRRLHRLVYLATALALLHHALQSKLAVQEPALLAGVFIWLMGWRALHRRRRDTVALLVALALAAGLATAALEAAWYAVATGIDAVAVARANLVYELAPRPAATVFLAGLAAAVVAAHRGGATRATTVRR